MDDGTPIKWTAFDAATQHYRDGVIDSATYDASVLEAFGDDLGGIVLGAVLHVLGE